MLLAVIMVLSIVPMAVIVSSAAAQVDGTDITLECGDIYTFTGASSVTVTSGDSVSVDGLTISTADVGETVLDVDGTAYTVNVTLPNGYRQLSYIQFKKGAILKTGIVFDSENVEMEFETDSIVNNAFGCCTDYSHQYFMPIYNGLFTGSNDNSRSWIKNIFDSERHCKYNDIRTGIPRRHDRRRQLF